MKLTMCPRCWCREREEYPLMGGRVMVRCKWCGYVFEIVCKAEPRVPPSGDMVDTKRSDDR